MHHLHIFVVHPSACGMFCGGISSENQCCHGWMYVAPGSARVGSPTPTTPTPTHHHHPMRVLFTRVLPALASNLKAWQTHFSACSATVGWASSTVIQPPCLPTARRPEWLFVYESERPDKTESDKVMNTNLAIQFHFR